jgi:dihydrofolate synthase/folylpolyglutamate synthase
MPLQSRNALAFLASAADLERDPGRRAFRYLHLDRMQGLCERLGHPERSGARLAHIAGTKGKGSTATFTAALLRAAGLKTGLYTSPHVHSFWERIQVEGQPIAPRTFSALLAPHIAWARRLKRAQRPTYFEWVTALALAHFRAARCEAVVLEVGLGGRLDATNVVTPEVCAITRIDYDHTDLLGRTLTKIAREKAGILKPGVPCIVAPQPREAMRAIRAAARQVGAPLLQAETYPGPLTLLGTHQRENAGVAVGILKVLGIHAELSALAPVTLPGRIQVLRHDPPLVVDGAHNPLSVRVLVKTLRKAFPGRRWTVVFGTAGDKDLEGMLRELKGFASRILAVGYDNPRAREPREITATAGRLGIPSGEAPGIRQALHRTHGKAVCVTGSLWLAGEALAIHPS